MLRGIIKWGIMLSVCVFLMFFYGCSSGGGGGSSGSSNVSSSGTNSTGSNNVSSSGTSGSESNISTTTSSSFSSYSYYKFYIDNNSSSLYAVDPNNPTAPIYVANIDKTYGYYYYGYYYYPVFHTIFSWQYDANTYTIFNTHESYIIYSKNGLIYKLPTAINAGLIPIQVSNLNATICDLRDETLNSDPDLDFISVETAGPDGVCYGWCATTYTSYSADNQYYLVRLDMSSTDAPISISQNYYIDGYYYNYNTGNIGGVFIDNNGTYEACDENLANCITLNATDLDVIGDYPGKVYLCINGTEIYSFDKTSKALTWIYILPYDLDDYIQDWNNIYFDSNSTIYKLDTTSNTLTPLYTDTLPIDALNLTDNKIVYSTFRNVYTTNAYYTVTVYSIKTLNKTGGIPTTIYSFNSTYYYYYFSGLITTSDKIIVDNYYNATLIYDENGNLLQTFNGTIIGVQSSNSGSMLSSRWSPVKILIDNNVTSTLNAISMSDLSITTMTQSLPTDIVWWRHTYCSNNIFLITGETNINDRSGDIFFLDTSKANSFIRVTNTPDDEFSLDWNGWYWWW